MSGLPVNYGEGGGISGGEEVRVDLTPLRMHAASRSHRFAGRRGRGLGRGVSQIDGQTDRGVMGLHTE